jgi:hypothetical protein
VRLAALALRGDLAGERALRRRRARQFAKEHGADHPRHLVNVGPARRIRLDEARDDLANERGVPELGVVGALVVALDDLVRERDRVAAGKGRLQRRELVQQAPERPGVGFL